MVAFLTLFEESGLTPELVKEAYWCLVYHIPAGTAHSKEASLPTIVSISEKVTEFFDNSCCSRGIYFSLLSSGTRNLML